MSIIKHLKDLSPLRRLRYSNQADFINPDPIEPLGTILPYSLEGLIEKYKATRGPEYSKAVMGLLSKLIMRMLHQEVKRYRILKDIEMQELYNASFICLHQAMLAFDVSKSSIYSFPRFLQGYIKEEIKRTVRQRAELVCCGIEGTEFTSGDNHFALTLQRHKMLLLFRLSVEEKLKGMRETGETTEEVIEMFHMKHVQGYEYEEIAKVKGKTTVAVRVCVHRLTDKLRCKFKYFKKI